MGLLRRLGFKERRQVWIPWTSSIASSKGRYLGGSLPQLRRALSLYSTLLKITPLIALKDGKEAEDHPLKEALNQPAPFCSQAEWFDRLCEAFWLEGNFYAYIQADDAGRIKGLLPFIPGACYAYPAGRRPETGSSDPIELSRPNAYYYQSSYGDKSKPITKRFDPEDIYHLKGGFRSNDLLNGASLYEAYEETLATAEDALALTENLSKFGPGFGSVITGLEEGGPDAAEQIREALKSFYEEHEPFLSLPEGAALQPVAKDTSLPDLIQMLSAISSLNIARLMGVPLELLGSELSPASSFGALKEIFRFFLKTSGRAFLSRVADSFSALAGGGYKYKFLFRSTLAADMREQAMALKSLIDSGAASPKEVKEWLRDD